jgi:hypothetical protein
MLAASTFIFKCPKPLELLKADDISVLLTVFFTLPELINISAILMKSLFAFFYNWCEVLAVLIPLFLAYKFRPTSRFMIPVLVYLIVAFVLNLACIIIGMYLHDNEVPLGLRFNTYLYNTHSIIRFYLFAWFFNRLNLVAFKRIVKFIPIAFTFFLVFNFTYIENFFNYSLKQDGSLEASISNILFSVEAAFMILYCILYYIGKLQEDKIETKPSPEYWIVIGLSIFVFFNFFYYLFYKTLPPTIADRAWDGTNITYFSFCICISKSIYHDRLK